jgi:tetratricopeptide (TPR) repeat protein
MVEEIITALSRIRWLFVIARNSTFTYKGHAVDVKQVGRELGVRYVLEGSVRKGGNRVRITAQLIDAETGAHLWADRFDGSLEDVFDLQDQVATSVAGVIEPALQTAELRRSAGRPTTDLTAYDLYLRATQSYEQYDRRMLGGAVLLLDEAIRRDPGFGAALGLAAQVRLMMLNAGLTDDPERTRGESVGFAREAVRVAPDDPAALCWGGFALGYCGEDIDAAVALLDRSIALNPGNAQAWLRSALLQVYAGRLEQAIERAETAMRLNPRANTSLHLTAIAVAQFFARRFELAAGKLATAVQQSPSYLTPYHFLAACYAHMGRLDEARQVIEQLRLVGPVDPPRVAQWRVPEHRELLLSGLRLAMGEAT